MHPDKGAHKHPRALHPRVQQSEKYARKYTIGDLLLPRVTLFRIAYGPRQRDTQTASRPSAYGTFVQQTELRIRISRREQKTKRSIGSQSWASASREEHKKRKRASKVRLVL